MSRYTVRLFAFVTLSIALLGGTARAQVPRFDGLYVFGDSLADNGNDLLVSKLLGADPLLPPSVSPHQTYFKGRFSNGYVAAEYLWQALSGYAPGSTRALQPFLAQLLFPLGQAVDFAFGDTGTGLLDPFQGVLLPGLKGQVQLYLNAPRLLRPRRPLFVIVTGATDYSADTPLTPAQVVGNIVDAVRTLYRNGARDVMVVNLPDLGQTPGNAIDPKKSAAATTLSFAHNALLKAALDGLDAQLPALNIIQPDLIAFAATLPAGLIRTVPALDALPFNPPLPPGFHMSACLFTDPQTCRNVPTAAFNAPLGFAFWDIVHPTGEVHKAFATYMLEQLAEYYGD